MTLLQLTMASEGVPVAGAVAHGAVIDGRYRIVERLGRGGVGSVYEVVDLALGEPRALKLLERTGSARVAGSFEREYHLLASLQHRHVVHAFDYGVHEGAPYYTMELLRGRDLSGLVPLPAPDALGHVRDAARALAALHTRKLIHRDLSPRNLWLCEDGTLKLIDFGAATEFGPAGDVVGTPPFVPPEALSGEPLDQRTDLYSLGALLYWLLTGRHAFPVRTFRELPAALLSPVVPPSHLLDLGPALATDIDALVGALLSADPALRPGSAAELIDRIGCVLGGTDVDLRRRDAAVQLPQPALSGRERELKRFRKRLADARGGRGGVLSFEIERGHGGTRLLAELSVAARLDGALPVAVDCALLPGREALFATLLARLHDTRPEDADAAFAPHAAQLRTLGAPLDQRLPAAEPRPSHSTRGEVQSAVVAAVLALARRRPVVLMVDGLDLAEDAALATFAELAVEAEREALLIVGTAVPRGDDGLSAAARALVRHAQRVQVPPLGLDALTAMVSSMLGDVPYLPRLAERLYASCRGSPKQAMSVLRALVDGGHVRHLDGAWVLPQELPQAPFALAAEARVGADLAGLGGDARTLARALAVAGDFVSRPAARAITGLDGAALHAALEVLVQRDLLLCSGGAYRLADAPLVAELRRELDPDERAAVHRALGHHRMAHEAHDVRARVEAAVHVIEGGETRAFGPELAHWLFELGERDMEQLAELAPQLERVLSIFRAEGRSVYEQLTIIHVLTLGGYFGDRRIAERYGPDAARIGAELTGVALAGRLRRFMGGFLALLVGLLVGAVRASRRPKDECVLPFRELLVAFIGASTALSGVYALTLRAREASECAKLLAPLRGLGKNRPLALLADFPEALAASVTDHFEEAYQKLSSVVRRVDDPLSVKKLAPNVRARLRAGAQYALGVQAAFREDPEALAIADHLDLSDSAFNGMSAEQIRTLYYATVGDVPRYEASRLRTEMHAIRRGTAWQVETWMTSAQVTAAFRQRDALGVKHVAEQMARLERELPHLATFRRRAEGAYLLMRRRTAEALPVLSSCAAENRSLVGVLRARGLYASCLHTLGRSAEALKVAESSLARLSARERSLWVMTLSLQLVRARALSALGRHDEAERALTELAQRAKQAGPITRAAIAECRSQAARAAGFAAEARDHASDAITLYRSTGIAALSAHADALRASDELLAGRSGRIDLALSSGAGVGSDASLLARLDALAISDPALVPSAALELLLTLTGARTGALFLVRDGELELAAEQGTTITAELTSFVRDVVEAAEGTRSATLDEDERAARAAPRHRVFVIAGPGAGGAVAALLVDTEGPVRAPAPPLLEALASRLRPDPLEAVQTTAV